MNIEYKFLCILIPSFSLSEYIVRVPYVASFFRIMINNRRFVDSDNAVHPISRPQGLPVRTHPRALPQTPPEPVLIISII